MTPKMRPILICCIIVFTVVEAQVGLALRNAQQTETRTVVLAPRSLTAITGRQPPRLITRLQAWRSKMPAVGEGDDSITEGDSAARTPQEKSSSKKPERVNGNYSFVTSAKVPQNAAREPQSSEHDETTEGRTGGAKKTAESATLLFMAALVDGTAIDHEIITHNRRAGERKEEKWREGKLRGETGIGDQAQLPSPLNENRRSHTSQGHGQAESGFAQRFNSSVVDDPSAQRRPPVPSAVSRGDVGTVSIFSRPDPQKGGNEVARAEGGSKRISPTAWRRGRKPLIHPLRRPFTVWKSELSPGRTEWKVRYHRTYPLTPPSPVLYPPPAPNPNFYPLPPPSHNRWKSGPEIAGSDDSITVSTGEGETPAAANNRRLAAADGAKVADHALTASGHSGSISPLRPSAEKMTAADSKGTMGDLVEVGPGGGRVRRDVNNDGVVHVNALDGNVVGGTNNTDNVGGANSTGNEGGMNNTNNVDSTSATAKVSGTNSTDNVGGTNGNDVTSVTDAATKISGSGSETDIVKSTFTENTDAVVTSSAVVTLTSHSTDTNEVNVTATSTVSLDKSSPPSLSTTTKTAATPPPASASVDAASSAISSSSPSTSSSVSAKPDKTTSSAAADSDDSSRTTATESVAIQTTYNTTKSVEGSDVETSASSDRSDSRTTDSVSSVDLPTGPTASGNGSLSTQSVTKEITDGDDSATQPITTAESVTSLSSKGSKFGASWPSGENSVSPTDFSSRRTLRSTDASSSSAPTQPVMQSDSPANTDPPVTESSSSSPPAGPLVSGGSTAADDEATSPTPSDPEHSSTVNPEDVFGAMWTAEPVPHPEGGAYPEGEGEGRDGEDQEDEPVSEPGPDFVHAKMVWQEAWEVHLYFFAALFGCLGVYTLVCVLRLWRIHRLMSRRYFVSLNLLMVLLCATRVLYLTLDGYNSNRTFHPSLDYFLYSISFPCLTSAFSIQLYALLQATKMQFLPPTIQKMSMLMTIVAVHFAISIVTDVVVGMYAGMQIMLFVCQLFFILWGLFLFFGYAYIFRRLYLHAVKRQKNVLQNGLNFNGSGGLAKPKSKFTLSVAVKVTFSTAILGLVTVALEVYALVAVYKTFSDDRPEPWPWYGYHTVMRLVEFLMCATMSYVASQPFRYRRGQQRCCCPVLCAPCAEICCCGADVNRSDTQAGWSDLDQHQLRASFDRGQPNGISYSHDGFQGNGQARRGSKGGQKGGGDLTVAAKARIYFSGRDDVTPIVTSQPGSRPTSAASDTVENNTLSTRGSTSGSYEGSGGAVGSPCRRPQSPSSDVVFLPAGPRRSPAALSTPVTTWSGVVNSAYTPTTGDPQSPGSQGVKSRKSSIASSEFFLGPSVSLADSMASELDKAFRSMHEEPSTCSLARDQHASLPSLHGLPGGDTTEKKRHEGDEAATFPDGSVERVLGHGSSFSALRRSLSASGRCSFYETEPLQGGERGGVGKEPWKGAGVEPSGGWHQKLFRSRSDNSGGIRTKAVDNATYMSLLDIERRQQTLLPTPPHQNPPHRHDADPGSFVHAGLEDFNTASTQPTVTCVDDGAAARIHGHGSADGTGRSGTSRDHGEDNRGDLAGDVSRDRYGGGGARSTPPHVSDVTRLSANVSGVMTSSQAPYRTVIPVGGVRDVRDSERKAGKSSNLSPPHVPSTPTPFPPAPTTPRGFSVMNSPKGLLGYGDDGSDDLEV